MSDVPSDVLREILIRIPAESLLRLRAVCKAWKHIIDDPSFVQFHTRNLHQHSLSTILVRESKGGGICSIPLDGLNSTACFQEIDVDPFKQLLQRGQPRLVAPPAASCNGLILISHRRLWKNWAIWNPLYESIHELPPPSANLPNMCSGSVNVGFGYDAAADDYKVVRIDKLYYDRKVVYYRTLVYSMRLRCWRRIQDFPYKISFVDNGVYLNGSLHWQSREGIAVLHLGREEYSLLRRPHLVSRPRLTSELLDAVNGYLFLSYNHEHELKKGLDVWVMRDYGVENSWIKLCTVDSLSGVSGGLRPVAFFMSRRQIFLEHCRGGMFWLDLDKSTVKEVSIEGHRSVVFCPFSHGSLLRLDNTDSVVVVRSKAGLKRKKGGDYGRMRMKFVLRDTVEATMDS